MVGVTTITFPTKDLLGSVNSELTLNSKRKHSIKKIKKSKNKKVSVETDESNEERVITDLTEKLDDNSNLKETMPTQNAALYLHYNEGSIVDKSLLDFSKLLFLDNMEGYPPDYRNVNDNVMDRFVVYADTQTHARIFMENIGFVRVVLSKNI